MTKTRAALALLAAGLWAAAAPGAASAAITTGDDVRVNGEADGVRQHYDHTLAVNPLDANQLVVTDSNRWDSTCFVHQSSDAGLTWRSRRLELPAGASSCGINSAVFAGDGTLYVAYTAVVGQLRKLFVARSVDAGSSFEMNRDVGVEAVFSTGVAVDTSGGPRHGTVYVAYIPNGRPPFRRATVISSVDRGGTFSAPVTVAPLTEQVTGRVQMVIGPAGDVFVAYMDFTEAFPVVAAFVLGSTPEPPDLAPMSAHVARSNDGGRTFTDVEIDNGLGGGIIAGPQTVLPFPVAATDPTDSRRVYLVVTDRRRNGDWDVYGYRSTDGGRTWSPARRLNDDDPGPRRDQVMPWIDVAPDGRVDVVWLDRREDPGNRMARPFGTSSKDGGVTWAPNAAVSNVHFDSSVGSVGQGQTSYLGDRLALHAAGDGSFVVWPDSRNGNHDNGVNDLYARAGWSTFPRPTSALGEVTQRPAGVSPGAPAGRPGRHPATGGDGSVPVWLLALVAAIGLRALTKRAQPDPEPRASLLH